jgi:hypothetical protein
VLTTAPAGLADQVPRDLARLGRLLGRRLRGNRSGSGNGRGPGRPDSDREPAAPVPGGAP